jgi:broad specificity phosphatase PhoE
LSDKKIYLIRHGQTEFNKKGMVQGSGIDAPLNDEGRVQARKFHAYYKDTPFDNVYVSGLKRTHESVSHFIDQGYDKQILPQLNEISWGEKEGKPFSPEDRDLYHRVTSSWQRGMLDARIPGGESPLEVRSRLRDGMSHILSQGSEKQVLVCMHGRAMRVLLCDLLGFPLNFMDMFEHTNLGLYKLHYINKKFYVEYFNDQRHFYV